MTSVSLKYDNGPGLFYFLYQNMLYHCIIEPEVEVDRDEDAEETPLVIIIQFDLKWLCLLFPFVLFLFYIFTL